MPAYFFNIYSIPYLIALFISIILTGILLMKKRNDKQVQLFITTMILIAVFSFAAAMERNSLNYEIGKIWISINYIASIFAVTVLYHFSYFYLTNKIPFDYRKILNLYLFPVFFTCYIIIGNLPPIRTNYNALGLFSQSYTAPYSFFYPIFYTTLSLLVILTTYNFVRTFMRTKDETLRRQASYLILSLLVIFIGIMVTAILLIYSIVIEWELTMIFLSLGLIIITIGILKHGIFNVEFVVKKTFVYTLLILPLIGIFRLIELALGNFVSYTFFAGDVMARLIAAAIVAACFFPFRTLSIRIGDKIFPKLTGTIKIDKTKDLMIYKKQLEVALADGKTSVKEAGMLKALRIDLGVSDEEHEKIMKDILKKK